MDKGKGKGKSDHKGGSLSDRETEDSGRCKKKAKPAWNESPSVACEWSAELDEEWNALPDHFKSIPLPSPPNRSS